MTAQIKRLGPDDAALAEKAVRAFKAGSRSTGSLETFLRNPANYLLVGEVGGEAVGFLMAYRWNVLIAKRAKCLFMRSTWRRPGVAGG